MIELTLPHSVVSKINSIFILDCIGSNEMQIRLHCQEQIYDLLPNEDINNNKIIREQCLNRDNFIKVMKNISNPCKKGLAPLIHIHGHGDKSKGLSFPSGEYISWSCLMENFMIITENARGETTIILSSCYSYQVVTEFLKEYEKNMGIIHRLPFGFFYGYEDEVSAGIVEDEAKYIHYSLLKDENAGEKIMNNPPEKISIFSEYDYIDLYFYNWLCTIGQKKSKRPD